MQDLRTIESLFSRRPGGILVTVSVQCRSSIQCFIRLLSLITSPSGPMGLSPKLRGFLKCASAHFWWQVSPLF